MQSMFYFPLLLAVVTIAVLCIASTPPMRTAWTYRAAWMLCVLVLVLLAFGLLTHRI